MYVRAMDADVTTQLKAIADRLRTADRAMADAVTMLASADRHQVIAAEGQTLARGCGRSPAAPSRTNAPS